MCAVSATLSDEHGCLRKGSKSKVVKYIVWLRICQHMQILLQWLLQNYSTIRVPWPHEGSLSDLTVSIQSRMSHYPANTKDQGFSAKGSGGKMSGWWYHHWIWDLYCCKSNKRRLASMLYTFTLDENVIMEIYDNSWLSLNKTGITMIFHALEAANYGKGVDQLRLFFYQLTPFSFTKSDHSLWKTQATFGQLGPYLTNSE